MSFVLTVLIVAIGPAAAIEQPPAAFPGATEVFCCPAHTPWDENFDRWPDGWTRREGPGFPRYVPVQLCEEANPAGTQCLRIDLNGGAVAVYSRPIPAAPSYAYVAEGLLAAAGLGQDRASVSLTLLDQRGARLQTHYSEKVGDTNGWTRLRVGPVTPPSGPVATAVVGLHLDPGWPPGLSGSVRLGEIWVGRLPRISLAANTAHHVFTDREVITVTCSASGLAKEDPTVEFQLEDVSGAVVAEEQRTLKTRPGLAGTGAEEPAHAPRTPPAHAPAFAGSVSWSPPVPGPGYYRLRAALAEGDDVVHRRQLGLAVVRAEPGLPRGEFGWSLPRGDKPLSLADLSELIPRAGIGWVKYPLRLDERTGEPERQELARFVQALASQGVQLVGLLNDPPRSLRSQFPGIASAAGILVAEPKLWCPSLESAVGRMGVPVAWWQLGDDKDTSLVGYARLAEKTAEIQGYLDRISADAGLGFAWDWRTPLPQSPQGNPPWRFLSLSADPPLSAEELAARLAATEPSPARRWVVVRPLEREGHTLEARTADLVRQMVLAKTQRADGVFLSDPFSTDSGLMHDDGTAGELFLPFRTTAWMLGGAESLGSIQLPGQSRNHVFSRGSETVMVVWSDVPKREVIYLGDGVGELDLWGRSTPCRQQEGAQAIDVGPLPKFITGVDARLVRWRQSFTFAEERIPIILGGPHPNSFRLTNTLEGEVSGHLELVAPPGWKLNPRRTDFQLAPNEKLDEGLSILLPDDATTGRHTIRIDFQVAEAGGTRRFSLYRDLDLGPADVYIEVTTRLAESGELEVQQQFVNQTPGPVSFRCHLLAPDRRRQNIQVMNLGPGRQVNTYRLSAGRELLGKTLWLRAEQIDGPWVLNYRFLAQP